VHTSCQRPIHTVLNARIDRPFRSP
jgi:hypothetical protein